MLDARRLSVAFFAGALLLGSRPAWADGDDEPSAHYAQHIEYAPRKGPLVAGLALGLSFYTFAVIGGSVDGYDNAGGWLWLPVAGPWMTMALRSDGSCRGGGTDSSGHCCTEPGCPGSFAKPLLALDGLGQLSGAVLVTVAYAAAKPKLVPDRNVVVTPLAAPHGGGVAILGTW